MSIEAMKQALDALEVATTPLARDRQTVLKAQIELLLAIEQAERQEPDLPSVGIGVDVTVQGATVVAFYRRPNSVPEMFYSEFHPAPLRKKWVGLTDDEIGECIKKADYNQGQYKRTPYWAHFATAIEAALKEKNT